jgi:hypothetical protein
MDMVPSLTQRVYKFLVEVSPNIELKFWAYCDFYMTLERQLFCRNVWTFRACLYGGELLAKAQSRTQSMPVRRLGAGYTLGTRLA